LGRGRNEKKGLAKSQKKSGRAGEIQAGKTIVGGGWTTKKAALLTLGDRGK